MKSTLSFFHSLRLRQRGWFVLSGVILLVLSITLVQDVYSWKSNQTTYRVPTSTDAVFFTDVAVDNQGYVHVVWVGSWNNTSTYYVRGKLNDTGTDLSWDISQQKIGDNTKFTSAGIYPRVEVGTDGVVHVVFTSKGNNIVYLRNENRGTGSWLQEVVSSGEFNSDIALDQQNVPYVTWSSGLNSSRGYFAYRASANNWAVRSLGQSTYLIRGTRIAVIGSGSNATVHVIYSYQSESNGDEVLGYARGTRDTSPLPVDAQFLRDELGLPGQADRPDINVDSITNRLYVGFTYDSSGFWFGLARSDNNGGSWILPQEGVVREQSNIWPGNASLAPYNNQTHIVVERKEDSFDDLDVRYLRYDVSTNRYNSAESEIISALQGETRKFEYPNIAIGGSGKVAVWRYWNTQGARYNVDQGGTGTVPTATPSITPMPTNTPTPTPTPTPPKPIGSINVQEDFTASEDVNVAFTVDSGTPDEFLLRNDSGDWEPVSLDSNNTTAWTLQAAQSNACEEQTVYGQMRDNGRNLNSDVLEDTVQFDPGVDVDVTVRNPFLKENPTSLQDFSGNSGASDGADNYTRSEFYYGRVSMRSGECSGLDTIQFGALAPARAHETLMDGLYPFQQLDLQQGEQNVEIAVTDGAGHSEVFQETIILDQEAPSISNQISSTLTIVDAQGQAVTSSDSIMVYLRFENLDIEENLYGQHTGENKKFWGVWLANSTEPLSGTEPISPTNPTPNGTMTPTSTLTSTDTFTPTPTGTMTPTPTFTSTDTFTPTPTETMTPTPTLTSTDTITQTPTSTMTPTPTFTSTDTVSLTLQLMQAASEDARLKQVGLEELDWKPVEVTSVTEQSDGTYSFTVGPWSLYNGILDPEGGQDYYVYARVLDGAGNVSNEILTAEPVFLEENPGIPTVYIPIVQR